MHRNVWHSSLMPTTVNSDTNPPPPFFFWCLSLQFHKWVDLVPNRSRPDGTTCITLDLQTQGLILKLCFKGLTDAMADGSFASLLVLLSIAVDKYTIARIFYSWYHHCCYNFFWLIGWNILFLRQLQCLLVRQHSHLQMQPWDICGSESHFVVLVCQGDFWGHKTNKFE